MARRNHDLLVRDNDFRTWDELSRQERRTGITVLATIGIVAVAAVWFLVGGETSVEAETGAAPPPTLDVAAELDAWYGSTAAARAEVAAAAAGVRTAVAANDGRALQPACAVLGTAARDAAGVAEAPVDGARKAWTDGVAAYRGAAEACGHLFDGTQEPVGTLLARTTTALGTADGRWARLAADLGQPAPTVPAQAVPAPSVPAASAG
ncbi:hypothetical protein [Parafrankia sp. FMc2]|uniref:hypothetical protein n=1 Tax=Parafrankia sp. FMc2 TaxID=3233196 RepID=UPI0034D4746B